MTRIANGRMYYRYVHVLMIWMGSDSGQFTFDDFIQSDGMKKRRRFKGMAVDTMRITVALAGTDLKDRIAVASRIGRFGP